MAKKRFNEGNEDDHGFEVVRIPLGDLSRMHPAIIALLLGMKHGMHGAFNQPPHETNVANDSLGESHEVASGVWKADTELFTSEWSSSFAHGADTLLPVGLMFERLLQKGERLMKIDSLRWQKLICENMQFTARLTPFSKKETESSLMTVALTTDQGRMMYLKGDGNGKNLRGRASRNPVAEQLFSQGGGEAKVNKKGWHEYPLGDYNHLSDDEIARPGMTMCTAIDLINYAVLQSAELKHYDATGTRLFLGVKDFTVPDISRLSRVRVQMQHDDVKLSEKRFSIVPVKVEYIDSGREVIGGGLSYFAFPADDEAEKAFEQELRE